MSTSWSTERSARVTWARIGEPGDLEVAALIEEFGPVEALDQVTSGKATRLHARLAPRLEQASGIADEAIAERLVASIVIPGDRAWPAGLDDLPAPPHCLWLRGEARADLATLCRRSVAIVGARAATAYGLDRAMDLAAEVSGRRFTVLSGAALGIDGAAHRGALAVGAPTVAVLACGIDRVYPRAHEALLREIATTGVIVSELPPGAAPYRQRFLQRNRLIAAMTCGTVVIEAALRSGSLATAGVANGLGRPVGALPGPVTSMASAGCHQAIRDQLAFLVTDGADVIDLIGTMGVDAAPERRDPARPEDALTPAQHAVWQVLPIGRPKGIEALAQLAGLDPLSVQAALGPLELAGLARRTGADWSRSSCVAS